MDQFVNEWMKHQKQPFREHAQLAMTQPLQTILSLLDLMQNENVECTPQERAQYLELIRMCSLRMYRFIRNVDDAALPPRPLCERTAQDMAKLTRDVFHRAQPMVERAGCTLILEEEPIRARAAVNRDEMERILGNLISNAVNVSRFGGVVTLFVKHCEAGVRIGVRDCGVGMSGEKLAELLADSGAAGCAGLDGCRRLLAQMDSRLQGESEMGRGSCFWFDLQAHTAAPELATSGWERVRHSMGISVLELELSAIIARQEDGESEELP